MHRSATSSSLSWELRHGVRVGYSTAADGDQRHAANRQRWSAPLLGARRLIVPGQVHGVVVVDEQAAAGRLAVADGIVSVEPQIAVGVYGADCPGLVIATPDCLGIAHCGWRGTAAGLAHRLVLAVGLRSFTARSTWQAFIGPGISGAQYEVDAPVVAARDWPSHALSPGIQPGRFHLDLATVLAHDLREAGVRDVVPSGIDTATDPRLHSYRKAGPGMVQLLVAWQA